MKRVCCLYRVSTKAQAYDDLYLQKSECREFAKRNQWEIVKEIQVQGKSGLLDLKHRSDLQSILELAQARTFDILLVFMFDRIGRRNDETSVFTLVLAQLGIKIWSVIEGQQQFDSHLDKLQNFIYYWQAEGESLATSDRVKTKMNQIAEEGRFRGGNVPYGYRLVYRGRFNKKGYAIHDVEVDPDKIEIVSKIFSLYIDDHYGVAKIAEFLNVNGILSNTGKSWHPDRIYNLIKNPLYMGIIRNGDAKSEIVPELQIISEARFEQARQILNGKKKDAEGQADSGKYNELFRGRVYCGHCNCKMSVRTTSAKYKAKNGATRIYRGRSYFCPQKQQCGNISYRAKNIDEFVIRKTIAKIKKAVLHIPNAVSTPVLNQKIARLDLKLKEAGEAIVQAEKEKVTIYDLIGKAVLARDVEDFNILGNKLEQADTKLNRAQETLYLAEDELCLAKNDRNRVRQDIRELKVQLERFNDMEIMQKEEFAVSLVDRVRLFRNRTTKIEWIEVMRLFEK